MKNIIPLFFIVTLFSCSSNKTIYDNSQFGIAMNEFYLDHLCFPQNAEDYLYQTFVQDSINRFENLCILINSAIADEKLDREDSLLLNDYFEIKNNGKKLSYYQYNNIVCTKLRNFMKSHSVFIPSFTAYIYSNVNNVKFESDSLYWICININDKKRLYCDNMIVAIKEYLNDFDDDEPIFAGNDHKLLLKHRMNQYLKIRLYNRRKTDNLVYRNNSTISPQLMERTQKVIKEITCNIRYDDINQKIGDHLFIQYNPEQGYSNVMTDMKVHSIIKDDEELSLCLNDILATTNSDFICFDLLNFNIK